MMKKHKDWSYFEFKVGRYEPYRFYSLKENKMIDDPKFVPYKPQTKKLEWYVFEEDSNQREIIPLNVFEGSSTFIEYLLKVKKKYKDDYIKFAEGVRRALQYSYWSKCEWETIITSWPPFVDGEEIDRLSKEREERIKESGHFYRTDVGLEVSHKIDIYTQVMMNWDRFIDYVWNNKRLITKKKLWGDE